MCKPVRSSSGAATAVVALVALGLVATVLVAWGPLLAATALSAVLWLSLIAAVVTGGGIATRLWMSRYTPLGGDWSAPEEFDGDPATGPLELEEGPAALEGAPEGYWEPLEVAPVDLAALEAPVRVEATRLTPPDARNGARRTPRSTPRPE